jgi:hypothetical protein
MPFNEEVKAACENDIPILLFKINNKIRCPN